MIDTDKTADIVESVVPHIGVARQATVRPADQNKFVHAQVSDELVDIVSLLDVRVLRAILTRAPLAAGIEDDNPVGFGECSLLLNKDLRCHGPPGDEQDWRTLVPNPAEPEVVDTSKHFRRHFETRGPFLVFSHPKL